MLTKEDSIQNKIFTKPYNFMLTVSILSYTGHYMLMATMPLYAKELGGSNVTAGMMVTAFTISALLFRPIFGSFIDCKGRKFVIVTGAIIFVLVSVLYNIASSIFILIILRVINGIGFSAHTSAAGTIASDLTPKSRLAEGIGYYGISIIIGTAIGPSLGLYLSTHSGYKFMFLCVFIIWVMGLHFSFFISYEKKTRKAQDSVNSAAVTNNITIENKKVKNSFFEKTSLLPSCVMFFVSLTFGSVIAFLPSYGIVRGIENIGTFFIIYSIAVLISRLTTGKLADKHGFMIVLVPSLAALFLSMLILAFANTLTVVLIAAVFFGIGFGTSYPLTNAIVIKLCPEKRRGAATSTLLAAMDIGIGSGALVWGAILEVAGFTTVYLASSACVVLSILVYIFFVHKKLEK
ncbi:MAG: MFS transporter [Bacillota bacterium]